MKLWDYIRGVLVAEDEAGNVAGGSDPKNPLAGNPHFTLSQRWGFNCIKLGQKGACLKCRILTRIQNAIGWCVGWPPIADHCANALSGVDLDHTQPSAG